MGLISNGSTIFDAGSMSSGFGGSMVFIKKLTASGSSTLSFVDGASGVVLDNTYKEYMFTFNNIHGSENNFKFQFNLSTDGGSNYNVTKTTTYFRAYHTEGGASGLGYRTAGDLTQSTDYQILFIDLENQNDNSGSGSMQLFNPSSTTFVKHFMATSSFIQNSEVAQNSFVAGYGNTTSAVNAIRFQGSSGNIDSGDICLYGIA
jgi:hypothetical protein